MSSLYEDGYPAVYDFALFPYALGDVLTWNVHTAIRASEVGRPFVDILVCADPGRPASIYQQGLVHQDNYLLHLHELLPAFHTHPALRHIKIFRNREDMLREASGYASGSQEIAEDLAQFSKAIIPAASEAERNAYFIKFIYSHRKLNRWYESQRRIPKLVAPLSYAHDIEALSASLFRERRPVVVHFRLRRMDLSMEGSHTYERDSDFCQWYEFLVNTQKQIPEVQFIVLGRLPEKPLAVLQLENVTSLRTLGMNLGHELAMIAKADLFIGSSSGFAAMANFTDTPYFITKMGQSPCDAYEIPLGTKQLPFAEPNQHLVYGPESKEVLERLLKEGLRLPSRRTVTRSDSLSCCTPSDSSMVEEFEAAGGPRLSSHRIYIDENQTNAEIMHLFQGDLDRLSEAIHEQHWPDAALLCQTLACKFPGATRRSARYHALVALTARGLGMPDEAAKHEAWCAVLQPESIGKSPLSVEFSDKLAILRRPTLWRRIKRKIMKPSEACLSFQRLIRRLRGRLGFI
jgi:hypothetical protein